MEIVEIMERGNLITGASIMRAGRENKIILGFPEKAKITLQGIDELLIKVSNILSCARGRKKHLYNIRI